MNTVDNTVKHYMTKVKMKNPNPIATKIILNYD